MSAAKHTPTPWRVYDDGVYASIVSGSDDDDTFRYVAQELTEADAEHVVRAVNAHADLLMALEAIDAACADALNALRQSTDRSPTMIRAQAAATIRDGLQSIARAAIKAARGES